MLKYKTSFITYLKANNYSTRTVKNYDRDLAYFESFLEINKIDFDIVTKTDITLFKSILRTNEHIKILELVDKYWSNHGHEDEKNVSKKVFKKQNGGTVEELSTSSINRMLSALRSYIKFLTENDFPSPLSSDNVKLIKKEKKESQIADYDKLLELVECPTIFEKKDEIKLRNRAMLEVLFSTGMRISELIKLNRDQLTLGVFDPNNPIQVSKIYILGKGKKQRFVYLTERAKTLLEEYLQTREDKLAPLFIQYRDKLKKIDPSKDYRITVDYLQKKIVEYRRRLGIAIPTSAHSLRHGFATYLIENGANSAAVQILLGHESLATTNRYVHASDKFAEKTHKDFHPTNMN